MNYRHAFHAGNFADVLKHVLLTGLLRALARKDKPFLYLDTHAGRGRYDLAAAARGDSLARKPEWPDGIGRLWDHRADLPGPVADYVAQVREFNRHAGAGARVLRFYPGSPALARALLRPGDRAALAELHPEEQAALRKELGGTPRVRVEHMDGYTALRAFLPPIERRALVLIDPPFEAESEFDRIATGLGEALARFRTGVYAVWFPLTVRAPLAGFRRAVAALAPPSAVAFTLRPFADEAAGRLNGCGLLVINPPWRLAEDMAPALHWLRDALAREPGATAAIEWWVTEQPSTRRPQ